MGNGAATAGCAVMKHNDQVRLLSFANISPTAPPLSNMTLPSSSFVLLRPSAMAHARPVDT